MYIKNVTSQNQKYTHEKNRFSLTGMNRGRQISLFGALLTIYILGGCATIAVDKSDLEKAEKPPPYSSTTFEYENTPSQNSVDLSVGIVESNFSYKNSINDEIKDEKINDEIDMLTKKTESQLSEGVRSIINSKGFSSVGNFTRMEDMTFPEKDETDMVMFLEVGTNIKSEVQSTQGIYWFSTLGGEPAEKPLKVTYDHFEEVAPKYEQKGIFSSSSNIRVRVVEPLTGEDLWVKEISTSEISENFVWYYWFTTKVEDGEITRTGKYAVEGYDGRRGALSSLFSENYSTISKRIDDIISVDRLSKLQEDAEKLKKRWRTSN